MSVCVCVCVCASVSAFRLRLILALHPLTTVMRWPSQGVVAVLVPYELIPLMRLRRDVVPRGAAWVAARVTGHGRSYL